MPHRLSSADLEETARAQYKQGGFGSALDTINQAIEASNVSVASQFDLRVAVKEKLGDHAGALQDSKTLIRKFDKDPRGYLRAARVLQHMNKPNNAVLILERALKMLSQTSSSYSIILEKHKRLVLLLLPVTRCDPLTRLPLEIVEMLLSYLTFRQRTMCTSVSKSWRRLLHSLPRLWTDLDLTRAIKPVNVAFVNTCINRSQHGIHTASLFRVSKMDLVISSLTSRCNHLTRLSIRHSSPNTALLVSSLAQATRLTHLSLAGFPITQATIRLIMKQLPHLESMSAEDIHSDPSSRSDVWAESPPGLRSLTLRTATDQLPYQMIDLAGILAITPHLAELTLTGWHNIYNTLSPSFALQKELQTVHLDIGRRALQDLPVSLRELSMTDQLLPLRMATGGRVVSYNLPNLERLTCRNALDVTEIFSNDLSPSPIGLSYLSILSAELVGDWNVSTWTSPRLTKLSELKVFGARRVDHELVPVILRYMTKLQALDLSQSDVTGVGVRRLVEGLPDLKRLRVTLCSDLSVDAIEWAKTKGIDVDCFWEKSGTGGQGRGVRYGV